MGYELKPCPFCWHRTRQIIREETRRVAQG